MSRKIIRLNDHRQLSYIELGQRAHPATLFFHGCPGSARQADLLEFDKKKIRRNIFCFDRPGIAQSTASPNRRVKDFADDLFIAAKKLELPSVDLVGVSGGAPYAMGFAALYPHFTRSLVLVSPLANIGKRKVLRLLSPRVQMLFHLFRLPRFLLLPLAKRITDSTRGDHDSRFMPLDKGLTPRDAQVITDYQSIFVDCMADVAGNGPEALMDEVRAYLAPWGFKMEAIQAPTTIWHGTEDFLLPHAFAEILASQITHAKLKIIPNEGHFTLSLLYNQQILENEDA